MVIVQDSQRGQQDQKEEVTTNVINLMISN